MPRRAVIAQRGRADRDDASSSSTTTTARQLRRRASTAEPLRVPQGPRHRERLRAAARPRRHRARRRSTAAAGARAVRPAGRHRRRRRAAGGPHRGVRRADARRRAPTRPSGSWTTATATARSREMCGNGIRVFARHLVDDGLVDGSAPIPVATRDGVKVLTVDGDLITADMGRPQVLGETEGRGRRRAPGRRRHVDMGNPHAVAFVDDLADAGTAARRRRRTTRRLPARRERRVRRAPRRAARRDAGARARLGGDPLLRHRRLRGDGRRGAGRRRSDRTADPPARTSPTASTCPAARSPSPGPRDDRVLLTGPAVVVARDAPPSETSDPPGRAS